MPGPEVDSHLLLYLSGVALTVLWSVIGLLVKRELGHVGKSQDETTAAIKEVIKKLDDHNAKLAVIEVRQNGLDVEFGRLRGELETLRSLVERRRGSK